VVYQVQGIQFSPGEKYLITFSSVEPVGPRDTLQLIFNVFDVKTGKKLRNFQFTPEDVHTPTGSHLSAPIFKWAGGCQDKYALYLLKGHETFLAAPTSHMFPFSPSMAHVGHKSELGTNQSLALPI